MAKAPSKPTSKARSTATPKKKPTPAAKAAAKKVVAATRPKPAAKTAAVKKAPNKTAAAVKAKTVKKAAAVKKVRPKKKALPKTKPLSVNKAASKKTAAKAATPARKTTAIKPAKAKVTTAKSKAKTAAKTTISKAPLKKRAAKKPNVMAPAARKTATLSKAARAGLQTQLESISARLKAADKLTRTQVKGLEADFTALAAQMGRTKAGHTRLTRRVTELSKTLTKDMGDMQADISRDLARALNNPTLETLQTALTAADARLSESEAAQNAAIARINHHISDIATIVEARLSDEASAREAAMAEMKTAMQASQAQLKASQAALQEEQARAANAMQLRFTNMQGESADAIRTIGDKVVDVAEEMGRRRESLARELRQELNESTLSSSAEFEQFRRVVERRLEALEADVNSVEGHIDRAVAPLTSRVEGLEYGLTSAPAPAPEAPHYPAAPAMSAAISPLSAPVDTGHSYSAQSPAPQNSYIGEDAFSPAPAAQPIAIAPPQMPAAVAPQPQVQDAVPLGREDIIPDAPKAVPYDPQAYAQAAVQPAAAQQVAYSQPDQYAQQALQPAAYPAAVEPSVQNPYHAPHGYEAPAYEAAPYAQPAAYDQAPNNLAPYTQDTPPFPSADIAAGLPPIADGDLPYADPAYAEADESMGAARPGAFEGLKKIGSKARAKGPKGEGLAAKLSGGSILTPRNLKVGGMVAALGLVSFIGVQTLSKSGAVPPAGEFQTADVAEDMIPSLGNGAILPPKLGPDGEVLGAEGQMKMAEGLQIGQEAIGQYEDNRKMAMAPGGQSALEQAASSGNAIAQLQLGLSKLDGGDVDGAVPLIRAAANQGQPAALYRLAKLYETGQGVGQDDKTARQLTERAARGGNRIAMHDLALYFAEPGGRGGVEMDMPTAAKWFEKAAERGVVDSQYNLGILFESGQGLPQDMEAALVWYSIAGAQGDQMAAGRVGVLRKTLPEDQVARADDRIAAFTPSRIDEQANGIFKDLPWAQASQVASANPADDAQRASVRQTQTLLNELGFEVGVADGAIGPKTRTAIKTFERTNGLEETGVVSSELIERLEIAAGA